MTNDLSPSQCDITVMAHRRANCILRRLHSDLMYCYKNVFDLVTVNIDDIFEFISTTKTRGNAYKLFKSRCTSRLVFVVISLLNVLSTCGIASHHLFAFLLCHVSDEQYVMIFYRFYEMHLVCLCFKSMSVCY